MIIFIEGVDGSGKSTLMTQLCNYLDVNNIKYYTDKQGDIETRPDAENRVDFYALSANMARMALDNSAVYLFDRSPLSDIVYRLFDDHKPVMTLKEFISFLSGINENKRNILFLDCDPTQEKSYDNMLRRGDDNQVAINNHKVIYKTYEMLLCLISDTIHCVLPYNYTQPNICDLALVLMLDTINNVLNNQA